MERDTKEMDKPQTSEKSGTFEKSNDIGKTVKELLLGNETVMSEVGVKDLARLLKDRGVWIALRGVDMKPAHVGLPPVESSAKIDERIDLKLLNERHCSVEQGEAAELKRGVASPEHEANGDALAVTILGCIYGVTVCDSVTGFYEATSRIFPNIELVPHTGAARDVLGPAELWHHLTELVVLLRRGGDTMGMHDGMFKVQGEAWASIVGQCVDAVSRDQNYGKYLLDGIAIAAGFAHLSQSQWARDTYSGEMREACCVHGVARSLVEDWSEDGSQQLETRHRPEGLLLASYLNTLPPGGRYAGRLSCSGEEGDRGVRVSLVEGSENVIAMGCNKGAAGESGKNGSRSSLEVDRIVLDLESQVADLRHEFVMAANGMTELGAHGMTLLILTAATKLPDGLSTHSMLHICVAILMVGAIHRCVALAPAADALGHVVRGRLGARTICVRMLYLAVAWLPYVLTGTSADALVFGSVQSCWQRTATMCVISIMAALGLDRLYGTAVVEYRVGRTGMKWRRLSAALVQTLQQVGLVKTSEITRKLAAQRRSITALRQLRPLLFEKDAMQSAYLAAWLAGATLEGGHCYVHDAAPQSAVSDVRISCKALYWSRMDMTDGTRLLTADGLVGTVRGSRGVRHLRVGSAGAWKGEYVGAEYKREGDIWVKCKSDDPRRHVLGMPSQLRRYVVLCWPFDNRMRAINWASTAAASIVMLLVTIVLPHLRAWCGLSHLQGVFSSWSAGTLAATLLTLAADVSPLMHTEEFHSWVRARHPGLELVRKDDEEAYYLQLGLCPYGQNVCMFRPCAIHGWKGRGIRYSDIPDCAKSDGLVRTLWGAYAVCTETGRSSPAGNAELHACTRSGEAWARDWVGARIGADNKRRLAGSGQKSRSWHEVAPKIGYDLMLTRNRAKSLIKGMSGNSTQAGRSKAQYAQACLRYMLGWLDEVEAGLVPINKRVCNVLSASRRVSDWVFKSIACGMVRRDCRYGPAVFMAAFHDWRGRRRNRTFIVDPELVTAIVKTKPAAYCDEKYPTSEFNVEWADSGELAVHCRMFKVGGKVVTSLAPRGGGRQAAAIEDLVESHTGRYQLAATEKLVYTTDCRLKRVGLTEAGTRKECLSKRARCCRARVSLGCDESVGYG